MKRCRLCETRKPKRHCPGVQGEICTLCCGNERESTVNCPIDCEYLVEARRHEKLPGVNPDEFPHKEIKITEDFLRDHGELLVVLGRSMFNAALETPGSSDRDVRDALDALIRTYRTMESGLVYETRSPNPYAESIRARWSESLERFREEVHEATGMHSVRDSEVLGLLVFFQRVAMQHDNGRTYGKSFLSFLFNHFPRAAQPIVVSPES
jgi:hypothetical protein